MSFMVISMRSDSRRDGTFYGGWPAIADLYDVSRQGMTGSGGE